MTKELHAALVKRRHLRGERVLYDDDGRMPTNTVVRHWLQRAQRLAALRGRDGRGDERRRAARARA